MSYTEFTKHLTSVEWTFTSVALCILSISLTLWVWISSNTLTRKDGKIVPKVWGSLPFLGHALQIGFNSSEFLSKCYRVYGEIFCIKIFRKNFVVVCSRDLAIKLFNVPNSSISFGKAMDQVLHFDWAFCSSVVGVSLPLSIMRKAIWTSLDSVTPKIEQEVGKILTDLAQKCEYDGGSHTCKIKDSVTRFATRVSFLCFNSTEPHDEDYKRLSRFNSVISLMFPFVLSFPEWIVKPLARWIYGRLRQPLVAKFETQIQKCREESSIDRIESLIIRAAFKYADENKEEVSNVQIAETLILLVVASVENTGACITNTLMFLALPENGCILERLREEFEECSGNSKKILQAPLLNACILETARLTTNPFPAFLSPGNKLADIYLGEYRIDSSVDVVTIGSNILMSDQVSCKQYKNSTKFDPFRFLGEEPESYSSQDIVTWGSGLHSCPGKRIAIIEMKLFLAHLFTNFDVQIKGDLPPFKFSSTSSFLERNVVVTLSTRVQTPTP